MEVWVSGSKYGYDRVSVILFNKKTKKKTSLLSNVEISRANKDLFSQTS